MKKCLMLFSDTVYAAALAAALDRSGYQPARVSGVSGLRKAVIKDRECLVITDMPPHENILFTELAAEERLIFIAPRSFEIAEEMSYPVFIRPFNVGKLIEAVGEASRKSDPQNDLSQSGLMTDGKRDISVEEGYIRSGKYDGKCGAYSDEHFVPLSPHEYELLRCLEAKRGAPVSRGEIIGAVWDSGISTGIVEVYIRYLRAKLEHPRRRRSIVTVRGRGYMLL